MLLCAFALTLLFGATSAHAQESPPGARPQLLVGTKVAKPFAFKTANGRWTGISVDLLNEMNREFGYELVWRESSSTNELIDDVAARKLDLAIAAISMNPKRAELVDFTNAMYASGLGIAVRAEPQGALGALGALLSLEALGGLALFIGILVAVGFVVWLLERRTNPDFEASPGRGIWSGFWWSAVTMTTVGYGDKAPKTVPGRFVGLIWMFTSIILISGFTATVASRLTSDRIRTSVQGQDDLARVRVGAKAGESPETVLKSRGVTPITFDSLASGLAALQSGGIDAFVHDAPVLQYEITTTPELGLTIQVLPKLMRSEEYGIAVARPLDPGRRNDLRDRINKALLEAKTNGRLEEITRSYLGD